MSFDEVLLDRIAVALGCRAKAIKYHTNRFACAREHEADGEERLNMDVETLEDRPTGVDLSVWPDGAIRLGVHQPSTHSKGGWAFAYKGRGNVLDLEAADVIGMFEETLSQMYGSTRPSDAPDRIEQIWKGARLAREP